MPFPKERTKAMTFIGREEKTRTRREFVKHVTFGAAGIVAASGMHASVANATQATQGIIGPKKGKFAKYVKPIIFQDPGSGSIRPIARMDGAFLEGEKITVDMGTVVYAGKLGKEPYGAHTHDFDQLIYFLGGDCYNMGELNAEIELCLGQEKEKQLINSTTAVYVPRGFPHFPATVKNMKKRFYYIEVSLAPVYKETPVPGGSAPTEVKGMASKYRSHITRPAFMRKAPGMMNPDSRDDSGGALASITNKLFPTLIMCESLINSPYRFPNPDYHTHTEPEFIIFHGGDPDDPTKLGGEVELYLGAKEEAERYIVTAPIVWIVPAGVPHCPLIVTKTDRPFIFTDIRPFGTGKGG
jgi:uncharacterized RmlC-like cupin family protein